MPWARVHLESGRSSGDKWEVDASAAGVRIDVGAAQACVWQVQAPGVAPQHLEMYWDGEVLWVADLDGAAVRIDGQLVDDWYATAHGSRIEFGQAKMRVETSFAPSMDDDRPSSPSPTGRTVLDRPGLADAATRVDSGARGMVDSAATRVTGAQDALDQMLERLTLPSHVELNEAEPDPGAPAGGEPTRAAVFGGAASPDPMATRLVQTPEARIGGASGSPIHRRPPPPRIGAAQGVVRAPTVGRPPAAPPAERVEPARAARPPAAAAAPPAAAPPAAAMPPTATPHASASAPAKPKFAAPPPLEDARASKKDNRAKGDQKEMSLPPRTWALVGATVLALAYVILMDDGSAVDEEPPPAPVAVAPVTEAEAEAEAEAENEAANEAANEAENEPPNEEAGESGERPLVRRAVDALMAGRHREALALYEELRERHPRDEAYRIVAGILRERVGERCEGDAPCE